MPQAEIPFAPSRRQVLGLRAAACIATIPPVGTSRGSAMANGLKKAVQGGLR
jgi:hypothetical protein